MHVGEGEDEYPQQRQCQCEGEGEGEGEGHFSRGSHLSLSLLEYISRYPTHRAQFSRDLDTQVSLDVLLRDALLQPHKSHLVH